jgi:hypothetical protein
MSVYRPNPQAGEPALLAVRGCLFNLFIYGCETWSQTLKESHRLRVFENRVLRRLFESKRDEATGKWRKLHNEELHNLFSLPSIIRVMKSMRIIWTGRVERVWEKEGIHAISGKARRK